MSKKLPKLSETVIQNLSSEQSFKRGQKYYRGGAVLEPVVQGNEIKAYCEGSGYQPYRVSATLGASGIETISCTCPYDWGGLCKHQIALLLTWVHQPQSFNKIAPLDELLANRSQTELIALIKEMLKRNPDLTRLLEIPLQPDRNSPLNLEVYRRQIDYALREHSHYDYPNVQATITELSAVIDTADRFLTAGDWLNAGTLFALVLDEVIPRYDELYDEYGDIAMEIQRCAEGLDQCFATGEPDDETRQLWLQALLNAHLKDIDMGGIDLAYPAEHVLINRATAEEWLWIEGQIKQIIAAQTGRYSDWPKEVLIHFLTERLSVTGQKMEAEALTLELGSPRQQAYLLVEQGHFKEAITIAKENFAELPGLFTDFATALASAGADDLAISYINSLLNTRYQKTCLEWLANHAEKTNNPSAALNYWRQSLEISPQYETYQKIESLARQIQQWDALRLEILSILNQKEAWAILLEIALAEGDIPQANQLLSKLKPWVQKQYQLRLAQAAEKDYPQTALSVYDQAVRQLIAVRGRDNYKQAAQILKKAQKVYQSHKNQGEWQHYISALRQENNNLPALQDELNKAGL